MQKRKPSKLIKAMKSQIKTYVVSTNFSSREIQARNKAEALRIFKLQVGAFISKNDKIKIR
jgi:hypothetical protein